MAARVAVLVAVQWFAVLEFDTCTGADPMGFEPTVYVLRPWLQCAACLALMDPMFLQPCM